MNYYNEKKNKIIDEYSKKLVLEVGKKYNRRTSFEWNNFIQYFVMKKCRNLRHNYHGVIMLNYYFW